MAKPGSEQAKGIANGQGPRSVDLGRLKVSDEEARKAQEMIEFRLGGRCAGCGRRITLGFHFSSLDVRSEQPVLRMAACTRDDCDFAEKARDGATLARAVEFAWLDEMGADAPASELADGGMFLHAADS